MDNQIRMQHFGWVCLGFVCPITLTLLLNVGIFLDLPNCVGIGEGITSSLYDIVRDPSTVDIVVGLATVLIVFFAVLQLAYSVRHVTTSFVRGYLLFSKPTLLFVSSFISLICITGWFTFSGSIRRLDWILSIGFIPLSLAGTVWFFYWLTRRVTVEGMIHTVLSSVDVDRIQRVNSTLLENKDRIEAYLGSRSQPYRIKLGEEIVIYFRRGVQVTTTERGLVEDIKIEDLDNQLSEFGDRVESVSFGVKIADPLPHFEYNSKAQHHGHLFVIEFKTTTDKNDLSVTEQKFSRMKPSLSSLIRPPTRC